MLLDIMLSKISQVQKDKHRMFLYTYEVRNLETQIQEVESWLTGIETKGDQGMPSQVLDWKIVIADIENKEAI